MVETELVGRTIATFKAVGVPVPQGSTRAFVAKGRAIVTHAKGPALKEWRDIIGAAARDHCAEIVQGPVFVMAVFAMPRPKSRPKKDTFPDRKPDIDKLTRSLLDGLTGVVFRDDSQVVELHTRKRYVSPDEQPGVTVTVRALSTDALRVADRAETLRRGIPGLKKAVEHEPVRFD